MRFGLALVAAATMAVWLAAGSALALPKVGSTAPSWTATTLNGKTARSSNYRNKVVLLNFFNRY